MDYARSVSEQISKRVALLAWDKHYSRILEVIDLLDPSLKLTFEFLLTPETTFCSSVWSAAPPEQAEPPTMNTSFGSAIT
jgi:hypothetical protein